MTSRMQTQTQAPRDAGQASRSDAATYVLFELGRQVFGVPVDHVREILDHQATTAMPDAAPACVGLIDTRGQSIPVIDLARRFAMPARDVDADTRIIVFEIAAGGGARAVGCLAERVLGVESVEAGEVEPAPASAFAASGRTAVAGLIRREEALVTLLSAEVVFADAAEPAACT